MVWKNSRATTAIAVAILVVGSLPLQTDASYSVQPNKPSLLLASSYLTAQASRPALSMRSFEIGGINLDSTEAQVKQRFGNPQRVETKYWGCCGDVKFLYYGTTKISLIEGTKSGTFQVFALSTKQSNLVTRDGIQIGNTQQKILATFGKPSSARQEAGITRLFYTLDKYAASLWFEIQNGQVIEMGFREELT